MKLRHLFEAEKKVAVAAFGRLNPPTIGHNVLIKRIKSFPGDHFLFLSHSQGAKKPDAKPGTKAGENADPLSFEEKLPIIQQAYPDIKVGFAGIKTPIQMMEKLYELGYTDVIVLGGPERINAYKQQIPKYNGEGNLYNFNSIEFELSGDRDADADDASGMSASKLRKAVRDGDINAFKQGLMGGNADKLFAVIKDRLAKDSIGLTQKEPEMAEDVSPEDEDKFHNELDDLVHKYFGDSPDEEKMKKKMKKVKEGSVSIPAKQLHDMVLELVNDVDYNDTKTLAKIARVLGKEVFYKNDRVVLQDPDFDFYKDK